MPAFLYAANVSPRDRFEQIEVQMDNGSTALIKKGLRYDLTASEVSRASRFIVLLSSSDPANSEPVVVARLPIVGVPEEGDVPIWRQAYAAFAAEPPAGGSGGGSLLFGQADGSLTASLPWRAPAIAHFVSATLSVADPVAGNVDLIHVAVNGTTVATLSLTTGQATSTTTIDVDVEAGDLLTVARLAADGGVCQVQIDRG